MERISGLLLRRPLTVIVGVLAVVMGSLLILILNFFLTMVLNIFFPAGI